MIWTIVAMRIVVLRAITYPYALNSNDYFACNSEARAMDSEENPTKLLVCGVTYSASQVYSTSVAKCTDNPVPFVTSIDDGSIMGYRTFFSTADYPADGTQGAFTDAVACQMYQRSEWGSTNEISYSVVVLKYQAIDSQTQPNSMFVATLDDEMELQRFATLMDTISSKNDILFTNFEEDDLGSLSDLKLFYFDSQNPQFLLQTLRFSGSSFTRNTYQGFTSGTYASKFGILALNQIASTLWVGGSVKLASDTGPDYFPILVKMNKDTMAVQGGHVITPNNVLADTYYSIDKLVQNDATETFMGISFPRTSAHALKPYALADPLLLYVIRDSPGSCDEVDAMMVKFTTADTHTYSRLLHISYQNTASIHYWFAISDDASTLGQYGSSTNSIIQYKLEGSFQCQATGPFTGTIKKVTNNPDAIWAGLNKYACYPSASTNPLCEVVDIKSINYDEAKIVYVVNTQYQRNWLNALEYKNVANDAQGNQMVGKYILINGGETNFYQSEQSTPQIDQFYTATVTSITPTFANSIAAQVVSNCLSVSFTQTTSASYTTGTEYLGQAALVSGSQTIYNSIRLDPPTTITCTGTSTECGQCIFHADYRLSETQNSLSGTNGVFVETDLTTGKLKLYYKADTKYAIKSYIQSNPYDTTGSTLYHQFTILFNVGKQFVYPDCSPWCLYDPNNGSPLALTNQKPNREYYSTTAGTCQEAVSYCQGCLDQNPLSNNPLADGVSGACSTSGCSISSLDYTPPNPLLTYSTTTAVTTYSITLTTFTATLNTADVAAIDVVQLVGGSYVAPPWSIFTIGPTTLDINSGSGNSLSNEQLFVKFSHLCKELQNEVSLWDPQADFGSAFVQYVPFTLTITQPNCLPLDLVPQATITMPEGSFFPADATTNYHRIALEPGTGSVTISLDQVFVFPSDLSLCYAASISMCHNPSCTGLATNGPVKLATNPSLADGTGSNSPQLVVVKDPINKLTYVNIIANIAGQNQISPLRIVVCGLETLTPNLIPNVTVPIASVDTWITISPMSSLFAFSSPYSDIPATTCEISTSIYCLDAACSSQIPANNFQLNLGNLQIKKAYLTQSILVFIQATTKGLVQATNNATLCLGNSTVAPSPTFTIDQEYPGTPSSWLLSSILYSTDLLCQTLTYSLTLPDGSALSADQQAVISFDATNITATPPANQQNFTLQVILAAQQATGANNSVSFSLNYFSNFTVVPPVVRPVVPPVVPPVPPTPVLTRATLNSIQETTTHRIFHEIVRGEEVERQIFESQILNLQADTALQYSIDPVALLPQLEPLIDGSQFQILLDEPEVAEQLTGTYILTASIGSHNFQAVSTYTFEITISIIDQGESKMELALNFAPTFVSVPDEYSVVVKGQPLPGEDVEKQTLVLHQLPDFIDAPQDTVTAYATKMQEFMSFDGSTLELTLHDIDYSNKGNYTYVVVLEDQLGASNEYLINLQIVEEERVEPVEEYFHIEVDEPEQEGTISSESANVHEEINEIAKSTFAGVDFASLFEARKNRKSNTNIPPPVPDFKINPEGILTIHFNQRMIAPNYIVQSEYDFLFDFWIISVLDGSDMLGTQFTTMLSRKLQNQSFERGNTTWAHRLKFNSEVVNHTSREVNFQLQFEHPRQVSSTNFGYDQLLIHILKPEMFISAESFKPMTVEVFKDRKPEVLVNIPPIIEDQNLAKTIAETIEQGGDILNAFTTGNFFVNLLLKGSMQQLWGMIRALQLIFLSSLININHPPHTVLFFKLCMVFAQMDILGGEEFYEEHMTLKHTEPLTEVFETYGVENMNFFLNSGSFVVLQLLIILYFAGQWYLNRLAARYYQNRFFRKLGIWAYSDNYGLQLTKASQKLFMESYFDLVLCTVLNTYTLCRSSDKAELLSFFTGTSNILNNIIGSVCMLLVLYFPIYSFRVIKGNFGNLQTKKIKDRYEIFYDGIRTNTMLRAQYNTIFLLRRFITVLVLVFWNHPYFQVSLMMVLSVINFIYQYTERPQSCKMSNFVENVNELTILLFMYLLNVVLNSAVPVDFKYRIGWALIGISTFNVLVNVILLLVEQTQKTMVNLVQTKKIKVYKAKVQKKIDSRKAECETSNHEQFKEQISIVEAIRYCRSWFPERQWLLKNNIDISDMKEEQDFMELAREHKLFQRARHTQVQQTLIMAEKLNRRMSFKDKQIQKIRETFTRKQATQPKLKITQNPKRTSSSPEVIRDQPPKLVTIQEIDSESGEQTSERQHNQEIALKYKKEPIRNCVFMKGLMFDTLSLEEDTDQINEGKDKPEEKIFKNQTLPQSSFIRKGSIFDGSKETLSLTEEEKISEIHGVLRQHNPFNLDFMVEEEKHNVEEYSNQLLNLASLSQEQMLPKFFQNKGLCQINSNGNHCQQALMQTLLEVQDLKAFFIHRHFQDSKETEHPLMKAMEELFTTAYSPAITAFDDLKEIDIDETLSMDGEPAQSLNYIIQTLARAMTTNQREFDSHKLDKCIKASEKTGDISLFKTRIDSMFPSLAAQQFTSLQIMQNICKHQHQSHQFQPSTFITLMPQGSFEETVSQYFGQELKAMQLCPQCKRMVSMKQIRKLAILPPILVLNIDQVDDDGNEVRVDWKIPPYYNFKQYFFKAMEHWTEGTKVNYQAFAVITKENGEYVAMVRKQNYLDDVFEWHKFSSKHIHKIREKQALNESQPVLVMFRAKPDLKKVPAPPQMELQVLETQSSQSEDSKRSDQKDKKKKRKSKEKHKSEKSSHEQMFDLQNQVLIRMAQKNKSRRPKEE